MKHRLVCDTIQVNSRTCQFMTCLVDEAHDHAICPHCGTVKFGNSECPLCKLVNIEIVNARHSERRFAGGGR